MIVEFETNEREFLDWHYMSWDYKGAKTYQPKVRQNFGYETKLIKSRKVKPNTWYIVEDYRSIAYLNKRGSWRTTTDLTYIPFKTNKKGEFPKRVTNSYGQLRYPKTLRECTVQIRPDFKQLLIDFGLHCSFRVMRVTKDEAYIRWTLNTKNIDLNELLKSVKGFCPKTEKVIRKGIVEEKHELGE